MSYASARGSLSHHNNNNKSPNTSSPTAPSPTSSSHIPPAPTSRALEAVVEQHFGAIQTIFREFERDSHDTSLIDRVTHPEPRRVELLQDDRLHGERVWVREHLLQWSEKVLSEHRSTNGGGGAFVSSSSPTSAGGEGVSDAFAFGGGGGDVTVSVGGGVSGALHDGSFRAFASENVDDLLEVDSSSAFGVDYRKAVRRLGEIGSRLAAAAAVKMKRAEAAAATGGESSGGNPALTELRRRTVAAYQLQQQQQLQSHHHQGQAGRAVSSFSPTRPLQQQQKYNVPFTAAAVTAAGGRGLSPVSSVAAAGGGGDSNPQPYTWTNEQLLSVLEHPLIARLQAELARQDALLAVAMEENAVLQQQQAVLEEKLRVAVVSTRPMTRSRATETTAVAKGVDVALQCQLVSRLSTPFMGGGVVESTHGTDSVSGSLSGSPRTSMMSGSSSLQTRLYFLKFQNAALLAVVRKLRGELQQQQGSPSRAGSPSPLNKRKGVGLLTKGTQVRGDCTLRAANSTGNMTLLLSEVDALHRTFIEELFEGLERTGGSGGGGLLDGDGVWSDILQAFDNVLSRNPPHADALLSLRARAALALSDFGGGAVSSTGRGGGGGRQSSIASTSSASLGGDLGDLVTDGTSSIGGWSRASSRNAAASKGTAGGRLQSSSSPTPSKRKQQQQQHASRTNRRTNPKPDTTNRVTPPPPLLATPQRGAAFTSLHATPSLESPSAAVSSPSRRIPAVKFQLQETGAAPSSVVDHHREHVACQTDESWLDRSGGVQHTQSNAEFLSAVSVRGPETLSSTPTGMGVGLSASSRSADIDASLMMTMRSGSLLNMTLNGSGGGSGPHTTTTARYRRPQSARDRIQQGYPLRASISIVTPTTTTANTSADPNNYPSPSASVDPLTNAVVAVVPQRPPQKPSTLPSGRPSSAVSTAPSAPLCPRYLPDAQPAEPQNFFPFEHSSAPKFAPPAPVIPPTPSTPWAPTVIHPVDAERLDGLAQRTQRSAHRVEDLATRRETWERSQTEQALAAPLTTLSSHHVPVLPVTTRHPPVAVTPYDAVRPPLTTANSENGSAASSLLFPAHRPAGGGQVEHNVRGIPPKKPCLVSEEHMKTSPTFLPAYSSSSTSTSHPQRMGVGSEDEPQQQQKEEDPRQGLQIAGLAIALDGGGKTTTAEGEEDPGIRRPPSAPNAMRAQTGPPPPTKRVVVNSRKQPFHVPDI